MGVIRLGRFAGLDLSVLPSTFAGSIVLWVVLTWIGAGVLHLSLGEAILGGLIAVGLHWVAEIVHQLGHAMAARRTGYPMRGIRTWGLLSTALYPRDEPPLPASVHIRRALGGPTASLLLTGVAGLILFVVGSVGSTPWWVAMFFLLDNLLVMTLGAFLPLGFTDGSTLLEWWGKRE